MGLVNWYIRKRMRAVMSDLENIAPDLGRLSGSLLGGLQEAVLSESDKPASAAHPWSDPENSDWDTDDELWERNPLD